YWSDLYIYAFNILKVRDVCEDIVQEVFIDLWQKTTGQPIDNPRAFATLIFPHPESTLYGGLTYEEAYGTLDPDAPAYWRKYRNVDTRPNDTDGFQSGINDRIMRFADVLLMYAEAENEANGPTLEARHAFDRVRDRANMSNVDPGISKDDFREVVRRERVLELSAEDNRWMDLKRWGILEERFNDSEVLSGKLFNINRHEYYPIPQRDILTNPNLEQYADY
ncbi:MAG: RagB/SusD family nutrient uptake outer membrane protein, partial [Cytophagales bacterium]|nr:RagB/SusD family nutrient uptake outer membrane protein [Cytophagales bacterium]